MGFDRPPRCSSGSPLSRAVCRTCWTWYANGESVCPRCRTRLVGADTRGSSSAVDAAGTAATIPDPATITTPPAPVQPTADAPFPTPSRSESSGISWPLWVLIGGGALAVIAVVGLLVLGLVVTGALGPVTSSDGVFSVKVPQGWAQGTTVTTTVAKPVLALARLNATNGVKPEFVVADLGQSVPLETIEAGWDPVLRSGRGTAHGTRGGLTLTIVTRAPELST